MLSGYASASHIHSISDVTNLSSILDGITQAGMSKASVTANTGTFGSISAESATFSSITVQVADFTTTRVSAQAMTVGGSNVSVEGHTHGMSEIEGLESLATSLSGITKSTIAKQSATFQDLVVTGDVTFSVDQLDFQSLTASSIVVDGKSVSLDGHGHYASDISDFASAVASAGASMFASASHTHDGLQGLTSSVIEKDSATFNQVSASTATFENLTVTGDVTMSLSQVQFGSIMASSISVNGSQVSLEGHTHTASEISGVAPMSFISLSAYEALAVKDSNVVYFVSDANRIYKGDELYAATTFDQLTFSSIEVSDLSVNGSAVSLEGHVHSVADISELGDMLSGYASTQHSHVIADVIGLSDILSGITSSTIYKDSGTFDQVTADVGNFRLISVSGSANFQVNNVSANSVTVNGSNVSIEGHTHGASEITGLVEAMASSMESAVGKSALASAVQGLELSADATQKSIRETLASLISALKSVAGVVCMAFMTMFWAMDAGALSLDTKWEEVNPTTTIADVTATVNDEKLTILEYTDGTLIATNFTG